MANPTVSIVIPCRNYGKFLSQAVESALEQTWPEVEILIVDDGSTDDTPDIARSYGSRVRYLRVEGMGAYGARNFSLKHVRGDFFLNLDADNILWPDFVEKTVRVFLENDDPKLGFVYTQREVFGDGCGISSFPEFDPQALKFFNYIDMGSLIRMNIVFRFGFDKSFNTGCGDHDFFLTLVENGFYGQLINEPLLKYLLHGDSLSSTVKRRYDQITIMRSLIRKHKNFYTHSDKKQALNAAANRTLVAIINNRRRNAPLRQRIRDFCWFLRANPRHGELLNQIRHVLLPRDYNNRKR